MLRTENCGPRAASHIQSIDLILVIQRRHGDRTGNTFLFHDSMSSRCFELSNHYLSTTTFITNMKYSLITQTIKFHQLTN